jgi:hypothetical protein
MPVCSLRAAEADHLRARRGPYQRWRGRFAGRTKALASACTLALLIAAAPAQAKIFFRSASSVATSSASSITLGAPSATTVGDFLIMNIDSNGGSTAFSAPVGWTSVNAGTNYSGGTLGGGYSIIAYKVAAAADVGASYTISLGTTRAAVARIVDYVGVETSSPVENTFPAGTDPSGGASAASFSYPSVTTTVANSMVVFGAVAFPSGGATTITPPAGSAVRVQLSATGTSPDISAEVDDFVQAAAGTVAKTGTIAASSPWGAGTIALKPASGGTFQFDVAPSAPAFPAVTLKGQAQTVKATMNNFVVDDTNGESGWNVTVSGNTSAGKSPTFKEYCENGASACGSTAAHSYASGGWELPSGSLQLSTTGASWSTNGGAGTAPSFQCGSLTCSVDTSSQRKIVSTASGGGLGPWNAGGFGSSSLTLSAPSTLHALPKHEIYHEDLVWTLSSGP